MKFSAIIINEDVMLIVFPEKKQGNSLLSHLCFHLSKDIHQVQVEQGQVLATVNLPIKLQDTVLR